MRKQRIGHNVTVGLRLRKKDAQRLRDIAAFWTHDKEEQDTFYKAASAAANGNLLVVQVLNMEVLRNIVATFNRAGVQVDVEDLRLAEAGQNSRALAR